MHCAVPFKRLYVHAAQKTARPSEKQCKVYFGAIVLSQATMSANTRVPESAEFQIVSGLDLLDFILEAVDSFDERGAILPGSIAEFFHLEHHVTESVVQTDHILLLGRRRHEQAAKRIRAADLISRRT